jgi:hypothetical protein
MQSKKIRISSKKRTAFCISSFRPDAKNPLCMVKENIFNWETGTKVVVDR